MAKAQRTPAFVASDAGAWLRWHGETRQYLVLGEQSLGRCAIARQSLVAGGSTTPCIRHACQSGFFILEGQINAAVGNRTLSLTPGAFLNVRPGTPWTLRNASTAPARALTIAAPAGLDEFEFRTGLPLADPNDNPPDLVPDAQPLPRATALEYGIHLDLLPGAFDVEPCLRLSLPGEGRACALASDVYRPLAASHDTEGRYAILQVLVAPRHTLPWRAHAREDLFLDLLSGNLSLNTGGQAVELERAGFAHLPAGVPFQIANETDALAELLLIAAPAGLEHLLELTAAPWQNLDQLPPTDDTSLEKLAAHAGDFGIELAG